DSWLHGSSHHPATPAHGWVVRLAPTHLSRVPLPPTFNPHRPASAANASGFLLTALSNAHAKHSFSCNYAECASDKALTSFSSDDRSGILFNHLGGRHAIRRKPLSLRQTWRRLQHCHRGR